MQRSLTDISYVKELLTKYGFHTSKALGQNFLTNPAVCPRMAQECGVTKADTVLEIGPGLGVLTRELSLRAKKVLAIELDKRLLPILSETLSGCENVEITEGDVLKLDLKSFLAEKCPGEKIYVCANLPYYITSPVLMRLLEEGLPIKSVTAMVQKEAAERICAVPGSRECGAVSAAIWYYSVPQMLFNVGRGSFMPPPNVDSAVIRLDVLEEPPVTLLSEEIFFSVVRTAFLQRRKTAANSVSGSGKFTKAEIEAALESINIKKNARAEELTLQELAGLANILAQKPKEEN